MDQPNPNHRSALTDNQRARLQGLALAPGWVRYAGVIGASHAPRVYAVDMPSGSKAHAYAGSLDWMEQIAMVPAGTEGPF